MSNSAKVSKWELVVKVKSMDPETLSLYPMPIVVLHHDRLYHVQDSDSAEDTGFTVTELDLEQEAKKALDYWAELEAEFGLYVTQLQSAKSTASMLVTALGRNLETDKVKASYRKPSKRKKWNSKRLEALAANDPKVAACLSYSEVKAGARLTIK